MTIADVLSDAISAIEDYQANGHCADLAEEIGTLTTAMGALRVYLDTAAFARSATVIAFRHAALRCQLGLPPDPDEGRTCFGCGQVGIPQGQPRAANVPLLKPRHVPCAGTVLLCTACGAIERRATPRPSAHMTA